MWQRKVVPGLPVGWLGVPGLANGVAGIGLTLTAALHDVEPSWDRLLLLSQRSPLA